MTYILVVRDAETYKVVGFDFVACLF